MSCPRTPFRLLGACLFVLTCLLAPSALAQAPSSSTAPSSNGVLLGLRVPQAIPRPLPYYTTVGDSLSRSTYRTLLVVDDDGQVAVRGRADYLLVPRSHRFWKVGTKRSVYNNWVEDFVWAAPEGSTPTLAGIQAFNGEYCEGHRAFDILYAGPSYLAVEQRTAGYCEGAAHPWFFNTLGVVPIDSTTHTGLDIGQVLGIEASENFEAASQRFLDTLPSEETQEFYVPVPDLANWSLIHARGRWRLRGRLDGAGEVNRGLYADLDLTTSIPPAILGRRPTSIGWDRIVQAVPQAVDAVVAPDRSWILVLQPRRLTAHRLTEEGISSALVNVPVAPGTQIVMERWASGPRLRQWRQVLADAPSQARMDP